MRAEELWDMAAHLREMAAESRNLSESIDLCELAARYEDTARGLETSGDPLNVKVLLPV